MSRICTTYYNYTYRSDGVKMREQSTHQYTKLVMKISASGDTTYVQRNASDTHYRAHYGNYVKETGMPDKIYNEEGYIALHGDSVSYHFFERDYLGSVRAVFDLYGNLEQTNDYNVTGIPSSRHLGNADVHKHTGKEFQGFNGLAWYDNNARYYDPILGRFTTQDPLAEKYPWLSPYIHCANNPLRFVDPTGMFYDKIEAQKYASENYPGAVALQDTKSRHWFVSLNENGDGPYTSGPVVTRDFGKINPYRMNNSGLNLGSTAFGITNDSKLALINYVTPEFSGSLKSYCRGVKALSTVAGAINIGYGFYNLFDYNNKGGNNPLVFGKYAADIIVSSAMLLASGPAVPFMIIGATIYFIADLYTDGFGFDYSTPIPEKIKNEEDDDEDKNENIN